MAPDARGGLLNRDTSMRLNQVFDKPPYGAGGGSGDESGGEENTNNNDASVLSRASAARRNRVDRSRSSSQRNNNSNTLNQLSQLPTDGSSVLSANLSMEASENMSVQSSASRRAAGKGGRHRLTSATARRTSVTQDSILGLSANLMKAINGAAAAAGDLDGSEDEEDETLLLMEASQQNQIQQLQRDERPQAPSRTRSRQIKSRRSLTAIEGGGSGVMSSSGVMGNESCPSHVPSSSRKPQRTRDVNARRHHSMRAASNGAGMEKQPSSRKLHRKTTNERPRRTKSHQVVDQQQNENKSTDGDEGSEQTPPPPPPQSVTPRRSRPNEHSPSTRRTSARKSRPRTSSADKKSKQSSQQRRPTNNKSTKPQAARREKRKPRSNSTSEARGILNNEEEDLDGSFPSLNRRSRQQHDSEPAMDGSTSRVPIEGSHNNNRRSSRHQRIHDTSSSGMMKDNSSKRSSHVRRKNTKDSMDNPLPLRRKQSHDKSPHPSSSKTKNSNNPLSPRHSERRKVPVKKSTSKSTSRETTRENLNRNANNNADMAVSPAHTKNTVDSARGPLAVPELIAPARRATKRGSRTTVGSSSFDDAFANMHSANQEERDRRRSKGIGSGSDFDMEGDENDISEHEGAFLVNAGGPDFQAEFHDSDLSDSSDDSDDDNMSMDNSIQNNSHSRNHHHHHKKGRRSSRGNSERIRYHREQMTIEKKRRSNDTGVSSLHTTEESIGDFADFGNHGGESNDKEDEEDDDSRAEIEDLDATDDDSFSNEDDDHAAEGLLQFDPTQIGMVQRVKQISSDKKGGYEINGQTGQIAEIVDPITNLQDFSQAKGPLFNLFDDDASALGVDDDPTHPNNKERQNQNNNSKEMDVTDSPINTRRKSLFRRGTKKKVTDESEDEEDDKSLRQNFISPATLGYEDPLSPKEQKSTKSVVQKASGYLFNMIHNASISSEQFGGDLEDDKSMVSARSTRSSVSGRSSKSARKSIKKLFSNKKKDKGTLLPDEDLDMSDSDLDDGDNLFNK